MGSYYAIAAVGQAVLGILDDACPRTEFPTAHFELFQMNDLQKEKPLDEGISLFLYRVAVSSVQRNLPPKYDPNKRYRPSLPVDLYYLVTAWAKTAARQQRLLGWCMRTLEDTQTINASLLNHYGGPEQVFRATETVDLIHEPLSMQDLSNLWDLLKPNAHVSVAYVARMVYLDSEVELPAGEPVQTRLYGMAHEENGGS